MILGVLRITLAIPGNDSLKGKRKVVRSVLDRARSRFNCAAAEVADMDAHRRAVLGFTVVSNDVRHVNSMLDEITSFVSSNVDALVVDRYMDIVHVEDHGEGWSDAG
jgi:uncharacterized protein YlxP (DUF503 family)